MLADCELFCKEWLTEALAFTLHGREKMMKDCRVWGICERGMLVCMLEKERKEKVQERKREGGINEI